MNILLYRRSGDYIDCQLTEANVTVMMDSLSHKQAAKLLETFESASAELKLFLGIPDVEEPTVVIHMEDGGLGFVQSSCDMNVIVADPTDTHERTKRTPDGRNAFIYKTGCEPLERETVQQWEKLV